MQCPACKTEIAPGQTFCPACRARGTQPSPFAAPLATPVVRPITPPGEKVDRHERIFLIIACLVAAGALAIPRLLRSKAFGRTGKIVLGTGAALNTLAAVTLLGLLVFYGPELFTRYLRFLQNR